jgi:hypothetical protein
MTSRLFSYLSEMPSLKRLDLRGIAKLDSLSPHLSDSAPLLETCTSLTIQDCDVPSGFEMLSLFQNLTELDLGGCALAGDESQSDCWARLVPGLRTLSLWGTGVSEFGWLLDASKLVELNLSWTKSVF